MEDCHSHAVSVTVSFLETHWHHVVLESKLSLGTQKWKGYFWKKAALRNCGAYTIQRLTASCTLCETGQWVVKLGYSLLKEGSFADSQQFCDASQILNYDGDFDSILGQVTARQYGHLLTRGFFCIFFFLTLGKDLKNKYHWKDERNGKRNMHITFLTYVNASQNWVKNSKVAEASVDY